MEKISNKLITSNLPPDPYFYEKELWAQTAYLCGVDEVGRGCLAGPVVTAAVILRPFSFHPLLKDSKILTEKKRNEAATWIVDNSWYAYGSVSATDIDLLNIYKATQEAMKQAIYGVFSQLPDPNKGQCILIDAMPLSLAALKQTRILSFPFGESRSVSIAAASILAKVKRDKLMERIDRFFPGYGFGKHKGYGTKLHQEALNLQSASLMHRTTFIKNIAQGVRHGSRTERQQPLFW